ncbi:MAG: HAMP domain-containing sensor histidine kinase, partial [Candidatus Neomarinimicrobiota bacterium]
MNTVNKSNRYRRRLFIAITLICFIIVFILLYSYNKGRKLTTKYARLVDATMEIKHEATLAHLWFEEILSGDQSENIETVWKHLNRADWYAKAMLEGGQNPEGTFLPMTDEEMRRRIINVRKILADFLAITQKRLEEKETAAVGTNIDEQYDAIFNKFLQQADTVKTMLQQLSTKDLKQFGIIHISLIFGTLLLTLVVGIILYRYERRNSENIYELEKLNILLQDDISERKHAGKALQQSEERYRSLSEELTESNSMKELLLDVIAHDLKSPAGAIQGFAKYGLENDPKNEILNEINQTTDSLLNIINHTTTLSKVTIGDTIEKEELNLVDIINIIIKENSSQLEYAEMTLNMKLKGELIIKVNPIIVEVFRNYISNAIKYAKKGRKIIIDGKAENGYVTVNVKDFGKTIEKKDRENIFIRNVQLDKTKGRGLGLAIVKRIATAHDAEIGVKPNKS